MISREEKKIVQPMQGMLNKGKGLEARRTDKKGKVIHPIYSQLIQSKNSRYRPILLL
jgi:hypothetical protein